MKKFILPALLATAILTSSGILAFPDTAATAPSANYEEGISLARKAVKAYEAGEEDEAVRLMEAALPKVKKFSKEYESILNFLATVYMERTDNPNTSRILDLVDEHNRHELEKDCADPQCHLERGEYYMVTGNAGKAREEYLLALGMPMDDGMKISAYEKYALFLSSERDFSQAAEYYAMAYATSESADGPSERACELLRLSAIHYFLGKEFEKSVNAHIKVIGAATRFGYSDKMKNSSMPGLGNAYSGMKDYAKAAEAFARWRDWLKETGHENDADFAKAYERLATAEKFNKDYEASLADYDMAIELYGRLGMHDEQEQANTGKTMCLLYAGKDPGEYVENEAAAAQRDEQTRRILRETFDLIEQGGERLGKLSMAENYSTIAGCYMHLEDYDNALKYYELFIPALREALAEDFIMKGPKERELTWNEQLDNIREIGSMVALTVDSQDILTRIGSVLFDGALLSKGILLTSNVEFDRLIEKTGSDRMKSDYKKLKDLLSDINARREAGASADDLLALQRTADSLQLSLAKESSDLGTYTDFLKVSITDVANSLSPEEAAVEFITLPAGITSDSDIIAAVIVSDIFPGGMLVPVCLVNDVRQIMADPDKWSRQEYTAALWGNIANMLFGKTKVYFAPDGVLNSIGIEYLTENGVPVSDIIELHRVSSTRELVNRRQTPPLQYASLFGGIDYLSEGAEASDKRKFGKKRDSDGLSFAPLEHTRREVEEIKSLLNKHTKKTFDYTGTKASKAEFLTQDHIHPLGILHIATHGKYMDGAKDDNTDAMDRSILAFAGANLYVGLKDNDGVVSASEIASMALQDCNLVVLSACESGLGRLGSDGVFGLQRGFKQAGVRSLLVSLNEVADEATADMMIAFYRHLLSSDSIGKREALRRAQAEIRDRYPDDDTWASFILIDALD